MSQPPQSTFTKLTSASARLTHRRILAVQPSSGGDLHRIAAKIRELEDDVKTTLAENVQIEEENAELIRVLDQLQFVVGEQQERMDELASCLRTDNEAGECISQYEQDLGTVSQQISTLNELIRTKNIEYEELSEQQREAAYEGIRLKERSNRLLYAHNSHQQHLHALLHQHEQEEEAAEGLTFGEQTDRIANRLRVHLQHLSSRAQQLRSQLDSVRKEGLQRTMSEKERRIRLEYEVRLLRERKSDQAKKEGYLSGFYDEFRVQQVIDDMLRKEDSLRSRIAEQEEVTGASVQEWERLLQEKRRQAAREELQSNESARLLELQLQALGRQLQESTSQHLQVSRRLEVCESEGIEMSRYEEQAEGEVWERIRATEEDNQRLQRQYEQLASEVQFLQQTMCE